MFVAWRGPLITSGKVYILIETAVNIWTVSLSMVVRLGFGNEEILEAVFEQANVYHIEGGGIISTIKTS